MKYTININQKVIAEHNLLSKTDLIDWAIIDYLKDFILYPKSKRIVIKDQLFFWLNYQHLLKSLPLLNIQSTSWVSKRISRLKKLDLIKTYRTPDNTLYYTFTDNALNLLFNTSKDGRRLFLLKTKLSTSLSIKKEPSFHMEIAPVSYRKQHNNIININNKQSPIINKDIITDAIASLDISKKEKKEKEKEKEKKEKDLSAIKIPLTKIFLNLKRRSYDSINR